MYGEYIHTQVRSFYRSLHSPLDSFTDSSIMSFYGFNGIGLTQRSANAVATGLMPEPSATAPEAL